MVHYSIRVLLASVRNLGQCPCPRCFIKKDTIENLGTLSDQKIRLDYRRADDLHRDRLIRKARRQIYTFGQGVKSQTIKNLLKETSMVPIEVSVI